MKLVVTGDARARAVMIPSPLGRAEQGVGGEPPEVERQGGVAKGAPPRRQHLVQAVQRWHQKAVPQAR